MDKLGIEPSLFIAQLVNFFIIMFLLNVLLYKPMMGMLEKRKKKIQEGLELTEKMRLEMEKTEVKKGEVLEMARKDGVKLLEEARKQAKEEEKEILEAARLEAEKMIEKAKENIHEQEKEMQKQVKKDAIGIAVALSERLLSQVMTKEMQHAVIKKHLKQLETV